MHFLSAKIQFIINKLQKICKYFTINYHCRNMSGTFDSVAFVTIFQCSCRVSVHESLSPFVVYTTVFWKCTRMAILACEDSKKLIPPLIGIEPSYLN